MHAEPTNHCWHRASFPLKYPWLAPVPQTCNAAAYRDFVDTQLRENLQPPWRTLPYDPFGPVPQRFARSPRKYFPSIDAQCDGLLQDLFEALPDRARFCDCCVKRWLRFLSWRHSNEVLIDTDYANEAEIRRRLSDRARVRRTELADHHPDRTASGGTSSRLRAGHLRPHTDREHVMDNEVQADRQRQREWELSIRKWRQLELDDEQKHKERLGQRSAPRARFRSTPLLGARDRFRKDHHQLVPDNSLENEQQRQHGNGLMERQREKPNPLKSVIQHNLRQRASTMPPTTPNAPTRHADARESTNVDLPLDAVAGKEVNDNASEPLLSHSSTQANVSSPTLPASAVGWVNSGRAHLPDTVDVDGYSDRLSRFSAVRERDLQVRMARHASEENLTRRRQRRQKMEKLFENQEERSQQIRVSEQ